jgi:hypothetical protein
MWREMLKGDVELGPVIHLQRGKPQSNYQDSRKLGRDLNSVPLEYKPRASPPYKSWVTLRNVPTANKQCHTFLSNDEL